MRSNSKNLALLILRLGASAMLLTHGIPKIKLLFETPIEFPDPLGVGATLSLILTVIGEVVAPIFVIIGYKTKIFSLMVVILFIVAAFIIHGVDPFGMKEKALLYLLCFAVIAIAGSGKYAVQPNR